MLLSLSVPKFLLSAVILTLAQASSNTTWEFDTYAGSLDVSISDTTTGYNNKVHIPFYTTGDKQCSGDGMYCFSVEKSPATFTLAGGYSFVNLYYANQSQRVNCVFTEYGSTPACTSPLAPCPGSYGFSCGLQNIQWIY